MIAESSPFAGPPARTTGAVAFEEPVSGTLGEAVVAGRTAEAALGMPR